MVAEETHRCLGPPCAVVRDAHLDCDGDCAVPCDPAVASCDIDNLSVGLAKAAARLTVTGVFLDQIGMLPLVILTLILVIGSPVCASLP